MQRQAVLDVAEAVGRCAAALLDVDRMQLPLDVLFPEVEEFAQLGKIGSEVEFLPDEGLQQHRVIRQAIDDLRGGQPVPAKLQFVEGHFCASRWFLLSPTRMPSRWRAC